MVTMKALVKEVQSHLKHPKRSYIERIIQITIRILADELRRDPYGFVRWLERYNNSLNYYFISCESRESGGKIYVNTTRID